MSQEAADIVLPRVATVKLTEEQLVQFWSKVWIGEDNECWPWLAASDRDGYGVWGIFRGGQYRSHALAYALSGGTFEAGPIVRHVHCNNRWCTNPRHLVAGTCQDNSDDMILHGTVMKGDNHHFRINPENVPRGERNGNTRLTDDDVRTIRKEYASGKWFQAELAQKWGLTQGAISAMVRTKRRSWRHVL